MRHNLYIILFLQLFCASCGSSNEKTFEVNWDKVSTSKDFVSFFGYALIATDSKQLAKCIDSLEKYKPERICECLSYYDYYILELDSTFHSDFYLDTQNCNMEIDYDMRNILEIKINENDSIITSYLGYNFKSHIEGLLSLYDTNAISLELPMVDKLPYAGQEYMQRSIGTFVYCKVLPDSLENKTSWKSVISVAKDVFYCIDEAKRIKSLQIFDLETEELTKEQRDFINKLVPAWVTIYFSYDTYLNPPAQPPKPKPKTVGNGFQF